ncbi:hypothetical protein [Cupriavidus plantarum]|uniref:hypothetical protein n=1 Tax=Cupriavidus plantarum TaxID=942865 RepID=UPI00339DA7B2
MSATRRPEFSSRFIETYMDELMSMSDEEILEGQNVDEVKRRAAQRIASASAEAGKRRLAAAKQRVQQGRDTSSQSQGTVSIEVVRAFIRQAANDGRVTLAARQLSEMSDADALRLYSQLQQLLNKSGDCQ